MWQELSDPATGKAYFWQGSYMLRPFNPNCVLCDARYAWLWSDTMLNRYLQEHSHTGDYMGAAG